jgi:hypothetical protein
MLKMAKNEPAFPIVTADRMWNEGMTLRDYFAAQVIASGTAKTTMAQYDLEALFGRTRTGITREEMMAADAYRIADAMLQRRAT